MLKNKTFDFVFRAILIALSAAGYAFFFKVIVEGRGFLAMGTSGIAVIVSRAISQGINKEELESLLYTISYLILNIPIIIFAWNKVSKRLTVLATIFVITFSALVPVFPSNLGEILGFDLIDNATSAVLIGIIAGCACASSLRLGGAPGGLDVVSVYLTTKKGKSVGVYNFIINCAVLFIGLLVFGDVASIVYTLVYAFFTSLVVDRYYNRNKKVILEIITNKEKEVTDYMINTGLHGCTIIKGKGAYTNEDKTVIHTVISSFQSRQITSDLSKIDSEAFITNLNVNNVSGEFYIPPIK